MGSGEEAMFSYALATCSMKSLQGLKYGMSWAGMTSADIHVFFVHERLLESVDETFHCSQCGGLVDACLFGNRFYQFNLCHNCLFFMYLYVFYAKSDAKVRNKV